MAAPPPHTDNSEKWYKTAWGVGLITAAVPILVAVTGLIGAELGQDRSPQPAAGTAPASSLTTSTTGPPAISASNSSAATAVTAEQGAGQLSYKDKKLVVGNPCTTKRSYYIGLDTGVAAPPVSSPEYYSSDGVIGCGGTAPFLVRQSRAVFSDPIPTGNGQTSAQCGTAVEQHPASGRFDRITLRGRQTVCSVTSEGAIAAVHLETTAAKLTLVVTAWRP